MALSLERIKELVALHAPVLHMHPADRFMPCSVEWFMQRSELWLDLPTAPEEPPRQKRLVGLGQVTGPLLAAIQKEHPPQLLHLHLDPAAQTGTPLDQLDDVPLYANVKWVVLPSGVPEALEVNYLTFYSHNGFYDLGGLGLMRVGAHDGDWEHFSVRLHATTGALQGAWFNAHRSRDGRWVPAANVERTPQGRLKAYVALHGHGNYPSAGTWFRAAFLANDRCSEEGPVWRPRTCRLLPHPPLDSRSHPLIPPSADEAPAIAAIEPRVPSVVNRPSIELTGQEQSSALAEGLVTEPSRHGNRVPIDSAAGSVELPNEKLSQTMKQKDLRADGAAASAIQPPSLADSLGVQVAVNGTDAIAASNIQPLGALHGQQHNAALENGYQNTVGQSVPAAEASTSSVAAEGVQTPTQQWSAPKGTGAPKYSNQDPPVAGNPGGASDLPLRTPDSGAGAAGGGKGIPSDAADLPLQDLDSSAEAAPGDAAHLVAGSGDSAAALVAVPATLNGEFAGGLQDFLQSTSARPLVMAGPTGGANLMCVPSRGSSLPGSGRWAQQFEAPVAMDVPSDVEVLVDSGEWLQYLGEWGQTPSPAAQDWFWMAEPPVSRSCLLRVIGHLWPETLALD